MTELGQLVKVMWPQRDLASGWPYNPGQCLGQRFAAATCIADDGQGFAMLHTDRHAVEKSCATIIRDREIDGFKRMVQRIDGLRLERLNLAVHHVIDVELLVHLQILDLHFLAGLIPVDQILEGLGRSL